MELANLADPEIGAMLTNRGYRLVAFENVLGRSLDADQVPSDAAGVEVRLSAEDELDAWLEVVTRGSRTRTSRVCPRTRTSPATSSSGPNAI